MDQSNLISPGSTGAIFDPFSLHSPKPNVNNDNNNTNNNNENSGTISDDDLDVLLDLDKNQLQRIRNNTPSTSTSTVAKTKQKKSNKQKQKQHQLQHQSPSKSSQQRKKKEKESRKQSSKRTKKGSKSKVNDAPNNHIKGEIIITKSSTEEEEEEQQQNPKLFAPFDPNLSGFSSDSNINNISNISNLAELSMSISTSTSTLTTATATTPTTNTSNNNNNNNSLDSDIYSSLFVNGTLADPSSQSQQKSRISNLIDPINGRKSPMMDYRMSQQQQPQQQPQPPPQVNMSNHQQIILASASASASDNGVGGNHNMNMPVKVHVALHEEMTCIYDMAAKPTSILVEGSVQVKLVHDDTHPKNNHSSSSSSMMMMMRRRGNTKIMDGKTFYLSMEDPNHHIGDLTSYFDYATELQNNNNNTTTTNVVDHNNKKNKDTTDSNAMMDLTMMGRGMSDFVRKQQKKGCRVFRVNLPGYNLDHYKKKDVNGKQQEQEQEQEQQPVNIINYTGSKSLHPIPLLINSKVRSSGIYTRLGIKIRSNPSNKYSIKNLSILVAVPPNIHGESMKMSVREEGDDGTWDPMKRVVVWTVNEIQSGETKEVQIQFENHTGSTAFDDDHDHNNSNDHHNNNGKKKKRNQNQELNPQFPILVRCEGMEEHLSDIGIQIRGRPEDGFTSGKSLVLKKSFRLFHRKV